MFETVSTAIRRREIDGEQVSVLPQQKPASKTVWCFMGLCYRGVCVCVCVCVTYKLGLITYHSLDCQSCENEMQLYAVLDIHRNETI